jgi:hypothetical protein
MLYSPTQSYNRFGAFAIVRRRKKEYNVKGVGFPSGSRDEWELLM